MKSVLIEQMAQSIKDEIDKAHKILLHCHPNPDPDSVGSSLAMYHALRAMGKQVTVIAGDSEKPENLAVLPGFADIKQQTYGETDLSEFDLFVVLDSGSTNMITRSVPVEFPEHLQVVVVDHHSSNPGYGKINLIETEYPAVAQILCDLFEIWQVPLTADIAVCLFVGVFYDTGGFRYRKTTAHTFAVVARLAEFHPDFSSIISSISDQLLPDHLYYRGLAYDHIDVLGKNNVAIIALSRTDIENRKIDEEGIKNQSLASTLITVRGWDIGISIIEKKPGHNEISFRSRYPDVFDVAKIAELLGGGGHKVAAGVLVLGTNEEAKAKVIKAVYTVHPELLT